jgi:hypothetical protein
MMRSIPASALNQVVSHVDPVRENRTREFGWLGLGIVIACLLPALLWTVLNQAPSSGDESQYARASLELFRTLLRSPAAWMYRLLDVFPTKPNGLIWVGQFFVPVGYLFGSVDKGFLLSVWITQVLTVVVVYRVVLELTEKNLFAALLGSVIVASAPLFVMLGTYYMVESIQCLAVACFILIMVRAGSWDPATTIGVLLAATAFAIMTKATTPFFCIWPGLVALTTTIHRSRTGAAWRWREASAWLTIGVCLMIVAGAWYYRNWAAVVAHLRAASTGPVAAVWGKEDTFLNTLLYWFGALPHNFVFIPFLAHALVLLVTVAIFVRRSDSVRFSKAILVVVLEIATVLGAFSLSTNRETRYLVPLLPYIAILICWSVQQVRNRIVTSVALTVFGLQLTVVYSIAFGITTPPAGALIRVLDRDGKAARVLESIVARTCRERRPVRYANVVAIDPSVRGDWLAPEPANYVAVRDQAGRDPEPPCQYQYLGGNFFGSSAEKAWEALVAERVEYVVTLDPNVYPVASQVYNETLNRENFPIIWFKLEDGTQFTREGSLVEDSGIAIFRRTTSEQQQRTQTPGQGDRWNHVTIGRDLSDRGMHHRAVEELSKAASLEPANVEAWANLALAYERQGSFDQAVSAGERARQLNPHHYYVNLGLARTLFHEKKWTESIARAEQAAVDAPGVPERVNALALAGRISFQAGQPKKGCNLLWKANELQSNREILDEISSNGCRR